MFNGFTQETSDFLWELSFHNERPWFLEHKEQFERCLNQPFRELAQETEALMRRRYPLMDCRTHVSRIYRDARRLFGRGPYKDHLWFTITDGSGPSDGPAFWFEIGAAVYSYGMGFFEASPTEMEFFRRSVDANPARFERLAADVARRRGLRVIGPEYKRPKGERGPVIDPWYNRRYLAVESAHDFGGDLLTPELPKKLVNTFDKLMPMYEFLLEVHRAYGEAREEKA
ncbi:MAG: DUF2461 domain-containing protein [Oscillospiraceae bacterium]|nr:DUF2461 domain-containing protein [Oscillospiraceae bacterium]